MKLSEIIFKIEELLYGLSWKISLNILLLGFVGGYATNTLLTYYLFPPSDSPHKTKTQIRKSFSAKKPTVIGKKERELILQRNLFNKDGKYPDYDTNRKKMPSKDILTKSSLPIELLGTIYSSDNKSGLAVVKSKNNKEILSIFVGENLQNNVKLLGVYKEKIIILNDNSKEYIEISPYKIVRSTRVRKKQKTGSFSLGPTQGTFKEEGFERLGNNITVSEDYKKRMLTKDFRKVLSEAKAVPNLENGELNGFKLTRIKSGSIYEKSGLQNNDIIREINGVSLVDTAQAIKLLNSLRNESQVDIILTRGGSTLTFNLQVK
jgi:type II secretion system protein C